MTDIALPKQYVFSQPARAAQFIRALVIALVGLAVILLALNLERWVTLPAESPVRTIMFAIGVFIKASGWIGLGLLALSTRVYRRSITLDVDADGLVYQVEGSARRNVKWANVTRYDHEVGGVLGGEMFRFSQGDTTLGTHTGSSVLSGCLFDLVFGLIGGLYFLVLESILGTTSWRVTFTMQSKRKVRIFGYGPQMDEVVERLLPQMLPGRYKVETVDEASGETDPESD